MNRALARLDVRQQGRLDIVAFKPDLHGRSGYCSMDTASEAFGSQEKQRWPQRLVAFFRVAASSME